VRALVAVLIVILAWPTAAGAKKRDRVPVKLLSLSAPAVKKGRRIIVPVVIFASVRGGYEKRICHFRPKLHADIMKALQRRPIRIGNEAPEAPGRVGARIVEAINRSLKAEIVFAVELFFGKDKDIPRARRAEFDRKGGETCPPNWKLFRQR